MLQQVTNAFAGISFVYALYRLFAIMRKWTNGKNTRRRIGHELKQEPEKDEIFKDVYFRNSAGLWIYMQKWIPDSSIKVKGVVFVAHGIGEHIGRYHYFGKELANAGYLVYGIDHQGHGRSEGDELFVEKFSDYITDYAQFITNTLAATIQIGHEKQSIDVSSLPRFLFGHSMGGAITLATLKATRDKEWNGVILSAPALKEDPKVVSPFLRKISNVLSKLVPKMPVNSVGSDLISENPLVRTKFLLDPLVGQGGVTARLGTELLNTMEVVRNDAASVVEPVLMLQGEGDLLVVPDAIVCFRDNCQSKDSTLKMYPDIYHEILNSDKKSDIVKEIVQWLDKHLHFQLDIGSE